MADCAHHENYKGVRIDGDEVCLACRITELAEECDKLKHALSQANGRIGGLKARISKLEKEKEELASRLFHASIDSLVKLARVLPEFNEIVEKYPKFAEMVEQVTKEMDKE